MLSTQSQTHAQVQEHNYQHHTPTLTQTALGGQHLAERLTQLATGLGRSVNDHKVIKTQLENIAKEQQTNTHQTTPYTLIDSAADTSYVSDDTIIHRTMCEMITTTQQDLNISSGDSHQQISSESLNIIADGQFSMTNSSDNITLSAHTGKLEATAKQDVNIASSLKEVEVVATNKITLTAGGASITLDGADITIAANEVIEKSGKHSKAGGGVDGLSLAGLPSLVPHKKTLMDGVYSLAYQFVDEQREGIKGNEYIIIDENAKLIKSGTTTEIGETQTVHTESSEKLVAFLKIEDGWDYDS